MQAHPTIVPLQALFRIAPEEDVTGGTLPDNGPSADRILANVCHDFRSNLRDGSTWRKHEREWILAALASTFLQAPRIYHRCGWGRQEDMAV